MLCGAHTHAYVTKHKRAVVPRRFAQPDRDFIHIDVALDEPGRYAKPERELRGQWLEATTMCPFALLPWPSLGLVVNGCTVVAPTPS